MCIKGDRTFVLFLTKQKTNNKRKEREMKTRYVLLTALSALLVGAGANAEEAQVASSLKVATQAYTDSHLRGKDIAEPSQSDANKVVVYDGSKFGYTDKGAVMPNGTAPDQMLKWDATNSKWVAATGLSAGEAIEIKEDGSINVKYDDKAVILDDDENLTVPTFTGADSRNIVDGGHHGEPGLVPFAESKTDWGKWLGSDGKWHYIKGKDGLTEGSYNAQSGAYEIGLNLAGVIDTDTLEIDDNGKLTAIQADPYTAGDGIDITTDNEVSVVADSVAPTNALTVSENGVDVLFDNITLKRNAQKGLYVNIDNDTITQDSETGLLKAKQVDAYTKSETDALLNEKTDLTDFSSLQSAFNTHATDTDVHITSAERQKWDGKLDANTAITAATDNSVVKYDKNGLVVSGEKAYTAAQVDEALDGKADKATTLAGYGITDAYTKSESDSRFDEIGAAKAVQGSTDTTVAGLESNVGDITTLTTNSKNSTVAAINELKTAADSKITNPSKCAVGHKCALVQTVDASGNATEAWVDLTNPYTL